MKILRITRSFYPLKGGQENHILNLSLKEKKFNIDTTLITLGAEKNCIVHENYQDISIIRARAPFHYGLMTRFRLYWFIIAAIFEAYKLKKKGEIFDLVIAHDYWSGISAFIIAKLFLKRPFIYFAHGVFQGVLGRLGKLLEKSYFKLLPRDFLICVDDGTAGDNFFLNVLKIKRQKFVFVPHGIDTNFFKRSENSNKIFELRKKYGILKDSLVVVSTSKINHHKGSSYIVQGFLKFLSQYKEIAYLIFANEPYDGEFSEIKKITALTEHSSYKDRILYTGFVDHNLIPQFLSVGDIWVSMAIYSNLGNALLEAMSCELPVVVSNVGETSKVIKDNVTGLYVPNSDSGALRDRLLYLANKKEIRLRLGRKARRFIVKSFSWEKRLETELEIYKNVIKEYKNNKKRLKL